jgi:isopentenyl-diphosphate delta-isomerase
MGLYCQAKPLFHFIYRSEFSNSLIEHELDHVCVGYSDQLPKVNPEEAASFRYISTQALEFEMKANPEHFTVWFRICYEQVKDKMAALQQTA